MVVVGTAVAVALLWRRGLPQVRGRWLPNAAAAAGGPGLVVLAGFVARPHVQTVSAQ